MADYNIQQKDAFGNNLFPKTRINNVYDNNDVPLSSYLGGAPSSSKKFDWQDIKTAMFAYGSGVAAEVSLPHSWNGIDGHSASYARGTGTYEMEIEVTDDELSEFTFYARIGGGQAHTTSINGHAFPLFAFGYVYEVLNITPYLVAGTNTLSVVCDNTANKDYFPTAGDFNMNGGLFNGAQILKVPGVHLDPAAYGSDRFHLVPVSVSASSASYTLKARVVNNSHITRPFMISVYLGGAINSVTETIVNGSAVEVSIPVTIQSPHLWSKADPYLYDCIVTISDGQIVDVASRLVGVRYFSVSNTGFSMNGVDYPLRGVAMHQDLSDVACALGRADYTRDFDIITEIGCNFIRAAHYPHRNALFDYLDKAGIVCQTEIPWVNDIGTNIDATYLEAQLRAMIREHFNHPCICFWGMWNEIGNGNGLNGAQNWTKAIQIATALYNTAKSLDPSRLIGGADCLSYQSGKTGNIPNDYYAENTYPGWYYNNPGDWNFWVTMNPIRNTYGLFAMSEYGAGGNPNCHSLTPISTTNIGGGGARHDEEYQALCHEGIMDSVYNPSGTMRYLIFTSVWAFFDFAVASRREGYQETSDGVNLVTNPDKYYLNDKGLVTRDRQTKKDAFYLYKAKWNPAPMVYITSRRFTNRPSSSITIKVYSNCASLKLYRGGTLMQTMSAPSANNSGVVWEFNPVNFTATSQVFKVIGYDGNGNQVAVDEVTFSHWAP